MPPNNRYTCSDQDKLFGIQFESTANEMCYSDRTKSGEETANVPMKNMVPAEATPILRKRTGSTTFGGRSETDATSMMTETETSSDFSCSAGPAKDTFELEKYPIVQVSLPLFLFLAIGTKFVATNFPYVLAPWAAARTYIPASWQYDHEDTHFDNSAWTWGTDYFLAALMSLLAYRCLTATRGGDRHEDSYQLRLRSAVLLILYAISTLAGGYAHQNFTSVDDLNTLPFRVIWTVCVGTVTSAGAAMLWIGSELCGRYHANVSSSEVWFRIPTVPTWFCAAWGLYITGICVAGGISYKRPACDIFVAGTTQIVPTAYLVLLVAVHGWTDGKVQDRPEHACDRIRPKYRVIYWLGFLLNCPLLPMYPLLVQYTDWSLGGVNTLLHAWLTASWGMQAIGLRHFCLALNKGSTKA